MKNSKFANSGMKNIIITNYKTSKKIALIKKKYSLFYQKMIYY